MENQSPENQALIKENSIAPNSRRGPRLILFAAFLMATNIALWKLYISLPGFTFYGSMLRNLDTIVGRHVTNWILVNFYILVLVFDLGSVLYFFGANSMRGILIGFVGWYLINGLIWRAFIINHQQDVFINLSIFPINLITLIALTKYKVTRNVGFGILLALALNFIISLITGPFINGVCFIPFFIRNLSIY